MAKDVPSATANGTRPNGGQGGKPSLVLEDLRNVHRRKSTVRMLRRAVLACPDVTADREFWAPIVEALVEGATQGDYRDRRGCAQVLATLRAQNVDVLKHLDKNERLDDGAPTENVRLFTATFDRQG